MVRGENGHGQESRPTCTARAPEQATQSEQKLTMAPSTTRRSRGSKTQDPKLQVEDPTLDFIESKEERRKTKPREKKTHSPIKHAHRALRIRLVRKAHRPKPARAPIRAERNVRALHRARLPEQVLQVLPLDVERQLRARTRARHTWNHERTWSAISVRREHTAYMQAGMHSRSQQTDSCSPAPARSGSVLTQSRVHLHPHPTPTRPPRTATGRQNAAQWAQATRAPTPPRRQRGQAYPHR